MSIRVANLLDAVPENPVARVSSVQSGLGGSACFVHFEIANGDVTEDDRTWLPVLATACGRVVWGPGADGEQKSLGVGLLQEPDASARCRSLFAAIKSAWHGATRAQLVQFEGITAATARKIIDEAKDFNQRFQASGCPVVASTKHPTLSILKLKFPRDESVSRRRHRYRRMKRETGGRMTKVATTAINEIVRHDILKAAVQPFVFVPLGQGPEKSCLTVSIIDACHIQMDTGPDDIEVEFDEAELASAAAGGAFGDEGYAA